METEKLPGAAVLHKFWESNTSAGNRVTNHKPTQEDWEEQVYYLSHYGRGTEEALKYLLVKRPPFEDFLAWLQITMPTTTEDLLPGDVLTAEEKQFWDENGYVVIRNAVSAEQCAAARSAIWEFLNADPSAPQTWYEPHPAKNGLMLSFFDHPALNINRRSARIRKAYEEVYETGDIYLLMDKVSFNPPETNAFRFAGSALHWDVSLQLPIPFVTQGLLYLSDVTATDGAFNCVPGFHKKINEWMAALPADADPRATALKELHPVAVEGKAGDLVIWHQALPHCATPNRGASPRMVQYITYKPLKTQAAEIWK